MTNPTLTTLKEEAKRMVGNFSEHGNSEYNRGLEDAANLIDDLLPHLLTQFIEATNILREDNICTCERRVCHCGRYPTTKENDIWNAALDAKAEKENKFMNT